MIKMVISEKELTDWMKRTDQKIQKLSAGSNKVVSCPSCGDLIDKDKITPKKEPENDDFDALNELKKLNQADDDDEDDENDE